MTWSSSALRHSSPTLLLVLCLSTPIFAIVNTRNEYLDVDYYDGDEVDTTSMEKTSKQVFPWRQIEFISPSQELAQTRWWYEAPLSFSARGMDHLYLLNSFLMDLLQPSGLPDELLNDQLFTDPVPLVKENRAKVRISASSRELCLTCDLFCCSCCPTSGA